MMNSIFKLRLLILGIAIVCFLFLQQTVHAGGGPENVLVVVNRDSESSKLIANHYISLRNIPSRNVVYLDGVPFKESISLSDFRKLILMPILNQLQKRKIVGTIDYIVYSADFPTSVKNPEHLKQLKAKIEATGAKFSRQLFGPEASITSMTFFAGHIVGNNPEYMSLNSNRYYRQPSNVVLKSPFIGEPNDQYRKATSKLSSPVDSDSFKGAVDSLESLGKSNPGQAAVFYWLAKFYTKQNDFDEATRAMTRAIRMGWNNRGQILADPDFDAIKADPLFKGTIDTIDSGGRFLATRGFRQLYQWGPNGMLNHTKGQGERYFLSTVLAVTRNDGVLEEDAIKQIESAVAADFNNPRGKFFFCKTNDVRSKTRSPNFEVAIDALKDLGFASEVITTKMPVNVPNVLGLTAGTPKFSWPETKSKIIPGAICENLTSYGGRLGAIGRQTKLSEFLRNGAAGSSGTVVEPYAVQAKFPHPMIHVHYARGSSLAEAFYQSIHAPYQTLIVGDALCQPFAVQPDVTISGLTPMQTTSGKIELNIDTQFSQVPIAGMELFVDGKLARRDSSFEPIEFDTELVSDGHHEIRVVTVANNLLETRRSYVIPFLVDNNGHSVSFSASKDAFDIEGSVSFEASSNFGTEIIIVHNRVEVGKVSPEGKCSIRATEFGRGPIEVQAIARNDSGKTVASAPIKLTIQGPYAAKLPVTAKPIPKTRSKK